MLLRLAGSLAVLAAFVLPAAADDWVTTKLRGTAEVLIDEIWTPLKRGDLVADGRQVRTLAGSRIELQHGEDIIALDADTLVRIEDNAEEAFTIVHHEIGTVEVEAEVRDSYHLSVETNFFAAVVKGTRFVVTADEHGAAVAVTEGLVAVRAAQSEEVTAVPAGITASVRDRGEIRVAGAMPLPLIFDARGTEISRPATDEVYRPAPPAGGSMDRTVTRSSGGSAGFAFSVPGLGSAASAPPSGLDMTTMGIIGIGIGVMFGSLGLLFRRLFR